MEMPIAYSAEESPFLNRVRSMLMINHTSRKILPVVLTKAEVILVLNRLS